MQLAIMLLGGGAQYFVACWYSNNYTEHGI